MGTGSVSFARRPISEKLWPLPNHRPELDFWGCQQSFRNWAQEKEQNAGVWGRDEIRNIHGSAGDYIWGAENFTGALSASKNQGVVVTTGGGSSYPRKNIEFDAAKSVPTGPETVPQHIWQPVVLYLGRSA